MEGHKLEEATSITHLENVHRKVNILEDIEILKAAFSRNLLNDVISGRIDPVYRLLPSVSAWHCNRQPPRLNNERNILVTS